MHPTPADHLLHIQEIMCGKCVLSVAEAVRMTDRAALIKADVEARTVRVTSRLFPSALVRILGEAGFPAEPILQPLG